MQINDVYVRKHGDKATVSIVVVKDGMVQIKDYNGRHFVSEDNFYQFFKKVS